MIKNIDELWNTFIKKQDTVFKITTKENIVFIATPDKTILPG